MNEPDTLTSEADFRKAPGEPDKTPIRAHVDLYGWRYFRFERWRMWYKRNPSPSVFWGLKIFRFKVLTSWIGVAGRRSDKIRSPEAE